MVAGEYKRHLPVGVDDEVLIAQVNDARYDSVNDAAGLLVLADGRKTTESGKLRGAEVQLDPLVLDGLKVKKCGELLFFCGGCDNFAHGKGVVFYLLIALTNITLISLTTKWLQRLPLLIL